MYTFTKMHTSTVTIYITLVKFYVGVFRTFVGSLGVDFWGIPLFLLLQTDNVGELIFIKCLLLINIFNIIR